LSDSEKLPSSGAFFWALEIRAPSLRLVSVAKFA
jgi:hypothetical protein